MGDAICKIYGVVDIIAALIVFFADIPIPGFLKILLVFILFFKAIPSLMA